MALAWGIKQSFREYVAGLPDGTTELLDGATLIDDEFVFPATDEPTAFRGAVRFRGHDGLLDVTVANPRVVPEDGDASIYVAEVVGGNSAASETKIARLHIDESNTGDRFTEGAVFANVTLTTLGGRLLGGVYAVGTNLDPVRLVPAQ